MNAFMNRFALILITCSMQLFAGNQGLSPSVGAEGDSLKQVIEKDRAETMEWLRTSPTSYLAAIARVDFGEKKMLTIGSDGSNDVVISEAGFKPRHLSVKVAGDSFSVRPLDPDARYGFRDSEMKAEAVLPPAYLTVDRFRIRLSHQRYPAIIVFDPESPRFGEYKGFQYYPVDPRYRFTLAMVRNPQPDTTVILSTRGNLRNALRVGWFEFEIDEVPSRLEVSRLLEPGIGETMYSIFFRDKTSGDETYVVGRYLDIEQLPDGRFVLDFNTAYNPACAVSPYYNCPLPPSENDLPVRILAGEKDSHYLAH